MTSPSRTLAIVAVLSVVGAGLLAYAVTRGNGPADTQHGAGTPELDPLQRKAERFFDRYVTAEGRVVRRDEGGDTVSEGQAYAMLMAVHTGEPQLFERVWRWTEQHLQRPDGLLSWRWSDGGVPAEGQASAADADLDTARALVLAARRFDRPEYRRSALSLGSAILEHETASTPSGRVLLAGSWVTSPPYVVNPSYVSPVAIRLMHEASGDESWQQLRRGSTAVVRSLTGGGRLPPDWAQVGQDGGAWASSGPSGEPVRYGYDAARTLVRFAQSCRAEERRLAGRAADVLGRRPRAVSVLGVHGAPRTEEKSTLSLVAQAAALAAADQDKAARRALRETASLQRRHPGYYGDAWSVLGPMMLRHTRLGGCPPLPRPG